MIADEIAPKVTMNALGDLLGQKLDAPAVKPLKKIPEIKQSKVDDMKKKLA